MRQWIVSCVLAIAVSAIAAGNALAFCGFYVAKADTDLFNKASKVVLVRDEDKTVLTMANDYQGDPKEFAIVIPVPTFIEEGQIHVTSNSIIDHLDAYTAPRLVEYYDEDPCAPRVMMEMMRAAPTAMMDGAGAAKQSAEALGVTIEAEYTVGEYDIVILSAEQSDGLAAWLRQENYKIPDGAEPVLESYIKQDTKFFVAKVNLEEKERLGYTYLRPIQVAYESPKFMLPIRLGTVNAKGDQELFIFTLTRKGRVETTNYRTVKIPTDMDVPLYVEDKFGEFYRDMFSHQVKKEDMEVVFLEYAWDMNWCDPCAADPLSPQELRELGVFWINDPEEIIIQPTPRPGQPNIMPPRRPRPQQRDAFVTRLHVRYNAEKFPEDLAFQQTSDRQNFQGRYVLRHPWTGDSSCEAATEYRQSLPKRFEKEAQNLAQLTGWEINDIREEMEKGGQSFKPAEKPATGSKKWWEKLWKD